MTEKCCWLLAGLIAALAACTQGGPGATAISTDTIVKVEDSLSFLRPAPGAPPFGATVVSFWAVKGENREARLMYRKRPGSSDSTEFLRFRVDGQSLVNRPDGSPIAEGDSLLITLTIADSSRLIAGFAPSGLVFNPDKPARLRLKYSEADPDLNHDGVVNAADTALMRGFRLWRQESPGEPWVSLPSAVNQSSMEVDADIPGFTRYAVAY